MRKKNPAKKLRKKLVSVTSKKFLEFLFPLPCLMINEPRSTKATGDELLKSNHQN